MPEAIFAGLKVVDAATFVAAPGAATLFADFGADVIKLEAPEGDPYRGPGGDSPLWNLGARNKRSLALDLKAPEGLAILHRLLDTADVFICNFTLAIRQRLKISYPDLAPGRPRLIYAAFTGYGETGPQAEKTGFDSTAYWSRSGLMNQARGGPDADPIWPIAGVGDQPAAVALFSAIVSALYRRERTGAGGEVTTSLLATGLWANALPIQLALSGAPIAPRPPRAQAANALVNTYRCGDGRWITLMILNERRRIADLLGALGLARLMDDPNFATAEARRANAPALIAHFDAAFAAHDLAYWQETLDAAGATFDVVGAAEHAAADAQARAIGAIEPYADRPDMLTVQAPFHIGEGGRRPARRAPRLGEHNREILGEIGYAEAEIEALRSAGVLAGKP